MAFLINQIKEQKILEMEVNLDDFIKEHGISESAMIHTMIFDKEVFVKEEEVREYLKLQYMWEPTIVEEGDSFVAGIMSDRQTDPDTEVTVELRRGVIAKAGDLIPIYSSREMEFNSKGAYSMVSKIDTVNFNEGLPHTIEIAKVATGFHPRYGNIEVTQDHLESFVKNFDSKVMDIDLAVNEDHQKNEAFGWFKEVFLSFDKKTLYGQIQWNTKGTQALSDKDYRYFSPEFNFNYTHELTGIEHGATLTGGALTNYPFLKMNALIELNNKNPKQEGKKVETIELSVHNTMQVDLNTKINNMQVELNAKTTENKNLAEEVKTLKGTIELNAKKVVNQKLFDEGKCNAAQLECLNRGGDSYEFASLADTINLNANGADGNKETTIELNSNQKSIAASLGLTDEEFNVTQL